MTSPARLDPVAFTGAFAYLASDIPPGVTLAVWRSQRCSPDPLQAAAGLSEQGGASADRAPQDRTLRVHGRARRPRSGRGPSPRRTR